MTISILARDASTGALGGAAATGSLCVGGWVLRGRAGLGLSASQGAAPSTLWGDAVLTCMEGGLAADAAVAAVTQADHGAAARQLSALDPAGGTGAFTGADNTGAKGARRATDMVVAGNLLESGRVLDAAAEAMAAPRPAGAPALADGLLGALDAAARAGGDSRGLLSAALLIVAEDAPPLTLRIDYSATPLEDLRALLDRSRAPDYADWLRSVPTLADPERRG